MHFRLGQPLARLAQEERAQVRDFFPPLTKRRDVNPDHAETVVQVFAELALGHSLLEVRIGGGEGSDVYALRARLADRHDLALLEEAEQLGLDVDRQVADFVHEQRAARRRAHEAGLIGDARR